MPSLIDNFINYIHGIKLKNALEKLSKQEFDQARGTAHRRMLYPAYKNVMNKIQQLENLLNKTESEIININKQQTAQFRRVIEQDIALDHLTEVPGIGPKLSQTIISAVYRGHLRDLQLSYTVNGVGQNRQIAINQWIARYEARIPQMMESDFPGKAEIIKDFQNQKIVLNNKMKQYNQSIEPLRILAKKAERELSWLQQVSAQDFVNARINQEIENNLIEHYQRGVFSEWEPMPTWFKQIMKEE